MRLWEMVFLQEYAQVHKRLIRTIISIVSMSVLLKEKSGFWEQMLSRFNFLHGVKQTVRMISFGIVVLTEGTVHGVLL